MSSQIISSNVKIVYDEFYENHDEIWRMLGAKSKAQHIIDVCKGYGFKKILEVGAGDGSIIKFLDDHKFALEYHAVEISDSGVNRIEARNIQNLKTVQLFDGHHLPFEDDSYDLVILSHVLEHVEHERNLLREIKRVANFSVIEVPIDYKVGVDKRIKHFLAYGHINVYTPTSLRYLLLTEGFVIENELTSIIEPEVTKYNIYTNQKKAKKISTELKIYAVFFIKKFLGTLFGKEKKELFANSFTVLCKNADQKLDIF